MSRDCPDIEELGTLIDLDPHDPRMAHVQACARCRNLLASMRVFRAPGELPPETDIGAAEAHLRRVLRQEVRGGERRTSRRSHLMQGWYRLILRPVTGLVLIAAVVAVVLLVRQQPPESGRFVLRNDRVSSRPQLMLRPPLVHADGDIVLRWARVDGATDYCVVVYDLGLVELARFPAETDTSRVVARSEWPAVPRGGNRLLWQVQAFRRGRVWIESQPAGVTLP